MTTSTLHSVQTSNHVPVAGSHIDAATRIADTSKVAADVGKFYRQLDNNSIWMLTATTPTWQYIGGAG